MTAITLHPTGPATERARGLRRRALSLRHQADRLGPVLATTYRRRAAELEFEAFLLELQAEGAGAA